MKFRGDGASAGHCIIQLVVALALLAAAGRGKWINWRLSGPASRCWLSAANSPPA